ncbi:endoplasmic oxidoreductin-1 [Nannizzia gypsea CBS 118893]|uniref:Endoplasmic oxidoreductin-1 n=1 Tax=Arthroderma gypseum (strain ATCC MYA-4604 / CBS 118893) TaxID=535722 RepID=E4UYH1_ARTGP|nr:endoplasmic oxidoreductin-1 [Nannizzia gypsea CBS 118893]EFR02134.1 endoplasmic oxidoreductin-1 [Nannizzia gypsea CBS 118893]
MGGASKLFYLAVFSLLAPAHGEDSSNRSRSCAIDSKSTVSDACASFATFDGLNKQITPVLKSLTQHSDFFSYYRLNLFNKQCPFWSDDAGMCGNIACSVSTLESEEDIPLIWRAEELSKLEGPKAGHPGKKLQEERPKEKPLQGMLGEDVKESCVVEYDDECDERDYCVPEDEGATGKGDYVSLLDNPERFTGYSGPGARHVWNAIYRENCFLKPPQKSRLTPDNVFGAPLGSQNQAVEDFRHVLESHEVNQLVSGAVRDEVYPLDDECLEKRVFHRLISGMHASISTHLCWDYFNQTTGKWAPNMQCFKERLHSHPERIANLYFNFGVLTRAVAKLQKHLQSYSFCISDPDQDYETKQKMNSLTHIVASHPQIFDETTMFQDSVANGLKEDFRNRFRNVSRVMDCIGCDKCRLWGKLQTAGYGAALKVLFEYDETKNGENPLLRRTELVALVNTLGRVSHSLASIQKFEEAIGHEIAAQEAEKAASEKQEEQPVVDDIEDEPDMYTQSEDEYKSPGIMAMIKEEATLIWRAYIFIVKSWINFPFLAWEIMVLELNRLWSFWLGLPVPPRAWEFHFPNVDEL